MGNIVEVVEIEIEVRDEFIETARLLSETLTGGFYTIHDDGSVEPNEYYHKWYQCYESFFQALTPYAEGYAVFKGEDGTIWKYELKNGEFACSEAKIVYEEVRKQRVDREMVEKLILHGAFQNDRYLATRGKKHYLIYDKREGYVLFVNEETFAEKMLKIQQKVPLNLWTAKELNEVDDEEKDKALARVAEVFGAEVLKEIAASLLYFPMMRRKSSDVEALKEVAAALLHPPPMR